MTLVETLPTAIRSKAPAPMSKLQAKALSAYRTISDVATELDVAAHVLRFWESKFPQIKPLKRNGGRRYYKNDDVVLLKAIRTMLYDQGMTIRGVQAQLKKRNGTKTAVQQFTPAQVVKELKTIRAVLAGEAE